MYCKEIKLSNFRNIESASVCFDEGVNILVGENAQGKTNLLEALFYASVGRSFRATNTAEMIRFGEESSSIDLSYRDSKRDILMSFKIFKNRRRTVEKNNIKIDRLSDIVGSFRAVLFCPEHLSLIKDGPSERRSYLDVAISRLYPMYIHSLQRYNHSLKQRNALLKSAEEDMSGFTSTVELWSTKMAEEAAVIADMRADYIRRASRHVKDCFAEMSAGREKVECPELIYLGSAGLELDEYKDRKKTAERYLELLMSSHRREIAYGATLWGVHKDDMDIYLDGRSARNYASQGQQRSLALALKLAEGEICREEFGDQPVFLFDDVLSELDGGRRDYLINKMSGKQVILTSCEVEFLEKLSGFKKITVKNGEFSE